MCTWFLICRDGRYGVARSASLSIDEQQRFQQYNQMISGRNIQQPIMSTPGTLSGTDRGVRMLPGGNGIGMVGGTTRTMPMTRPGFQGVPASSMVNSGSMVSLGMVSMPSAVNMHSGVGSGQGNSMLRPRESLHMMRVRNFESFLYSFQSCLLWSLNFLFYFLVEIILYDSLCISFSLVLLLYRILFCVVLPSIPA